MSIEKRGFASMTPERQREIASMGGRALLPQKRSFFKNRELAAAAGRKGGRSVPPEKRSYSQNRQLASEAGARGGRASPAGSRSFSINPELAREAGRRGGSRPKLARRQTVALESRPANPAKANNQQEKVDEAIS